jgi:hypothetical protein
METNVGKVFYAFIYVFIYSPKINIFVCKNALLNVFLISVLLFQLLIYGAIFSCLEPLLTVAAVFSSSSVFTTPQAPRHYTSAEDRKNYVCFFSFIVVILLL